MRNFVMGMAALFLLAGNANATDIGFTNGKYGKTSVFRLGNDKKQGQAIRLGKEKLQYLKGKTIKAAQFVVGSRNSTDNTMHTFIASSLSGTPIAETDFTISKAQTWLTWTLDTPYTITGDEEELYIGYTTEINTSYKMYCSDFSNDMTGCNFAIKDGEWVDTYGTNTGNANIRIQTDEVDDFCDVIMTKSSFDGYFKAGNSYSFSTIFHNFGTKAITSFDAVVRIGDKTETYSFKNVNIAANQNHTVDLTNIDTSNEGEQTVAISIENINGGADDKDLGDNMISEELYVYPANMERNLLLEGFTGQECSQCPTGHHYINNAISNSSENIIEVMHHAGYRADMFTMAEDVDYTFFYPGGGNGGTYAPAVMVNRTACTGVTEAPVTDVTSSKLTALINNATLSKPYASLALETELNSETRELDIKLSVKPHTQLPEGDNLLNVFLVQDSIKAFQTNGGTDYVHTKVFRGALTGNSWGLLSDFPVGEATTWSKKITIPETIRASYWTDAVIEASGTYTAEMVTTEAVLNNMYIVAFVAHYDNIDNTKNVVYNCIEVKAGESYSQAGFTSGIVNTEQDNVGDIIVKDGHISVEGNGCKTEVYNLSGKRMDATSSLPKGLYIVKVNSGSRSMAKKVMVK